MKKDRKFSKDEIEAIRETIIYARDHLSLDRGHIRERAGISGNDLDNFTTKVPKTTKATEPGETKEEGSPKYKTMTPRPQVLLRLIYFVASESALCDLADASTKLGKNIQKILDIEKTLRVFNPDDDHIFNHFERLGLSSQDTCARLCALWQGSYYVYRALPSTDVILKSHIEVLKHRPYNKVPYFVNRVRYANASSKISRGQIIELDNHYIFLGFITGSGQQAHYGVKLFIFRKIVGEIRQLDGMFVSYGHESAYEMGFAKLVRTKDKFATASVGEFRKEDITVESAGFSVESLWKDVSNQLIKGSLLASLKVG